MGLVDTIKLQNPDVATLLNNGENFSDIFIKKGNARQKYHQVNITVSEKLRNLISSRGNRLYIGLKSCRVVDRKHINRCYKCHDHTHLAKTCDKTPCCGYCASGQHESVDCAFKRDVENNVGNLKCINCQRNNLEYTGHSVYWHLCPINKALLKQPLRGSLPKIGDLNSQP